MVCGEFWNCDQGRGCVSCYIYKNISIFDRGLRVYEVGE